MKQALVSGLAQPTKPAEGSKEEQEAKEKAKEEASKRLNELAEKAQAFLQIGQGEFDDAKKAVAAAAAELEAEPFELAGAARTATALAQVLTSIHEAIEKIADKAAETPSNLSNKSITEAAVKEAIMGIEEPFVAPFRDAGLAVGGAFDVFAKQVLGVNDVTEKLHDLLQFDLDNSIVTLPLPKTVTTGAVALDPAFPAFKLDNTQLVAFLDYKKDNKEPIFGFRLNAKLEAGLRNDPLLKKMIPGTEVAAKTEPTVIQVDTADGLTLGEKKSKQIALPVHAEWPGLELRQLALAVPEAAKPGEVTEAAALELITTISGKLGSTIGVVVQGAGVRVQMVGDPPTGQLPFAVAPRMPDELGLVVKAGALTGGGYLYRKDVKPAEGGGEPAPQYGGALYLKYKDIEINAIGFIDTDPFSLVLVLSVEFSPAIPIALGFSLNGVGGLVAVDRRVNTDALRAGIRDHTVDTILFPNDPIASAPKILEKLALIFPPEEGAVAIGPIGQITWGSKSELITAKVGVVLSFPGPKLVLLGAIRVQAPNPKLKPQEAPKKTPKLIDLKAEIFGEVTAERLLITVGLSDSKLATMTINGDLGVLIGWGAAPQLAISVGGFFPGFAAPAELAELRRITIDMSPTSFIKLHAEAYVALTSNSLQIGGSVRLSADIGPVHGEGWITLDALFEWEPFGFKVLIGAGLSITAFGMSWLAVGFTGKLYGTTPWLLEGNATVDAWWLPAIELPIGPVTWGEPQPPSPAQVSPRAIVAAALEQPDALTTRMPANTEMLVQLLADEADGAAPLLVHPLGGLELRQRVVPLEIKLDRVGQSTVSERRVNLGQPTLGGAAAGAVSAVKERFAPGQFVDMSEEQALSRPHFEEFSAGLRLAAAGRITHGTEVRSAVGWETVYPAGDVAAQELLEVDHSLVWTEIRPPGMLPEGDPYREDPAPIRLEERGQVQIVHTDDLRPLAMQGQMTTTEAARVIEEHGGISADKLEYVSAGGLG